MVFVTLKYIIIGDSSVGKSSLLTQFTEQTFADIHDITVGVEFGAKLLNVNDRKVKLEIWDTAGQETFLAITRAYYRGSDGVILVYDIGNRQSFLSLERWLKECHENCANSSLEVMVVGMKVDIPPEDRQVTEEEAREWATKKGLPFIEASARTAFNVENIFIQSATKILENFDGVNQSKLHSGVDGVIQLDDSKAYTKPPTDCCG